jgi:hypothetical protein
MDDAQSHFGPLFVIMPVFGLVMDTCITGGTRCCDDGQHQNVSLGTTRHNLGWAKGHSVKKKKQAILLYCLQVCTHIMLGELTPVNVNHDITIKFNWNDGKCVSERQLCIEHV